MPRNKALRRFYARREKRHQERIKKFRRDKDEKRSSAAWRERKERLADRMEREYVEELLGEELWEDGGEHYA